MQSTSQVLEAFMVVSFGLSWPMSILKSWKAKTARGKSLFFLCMIFFGYICGILSKLTAGNITYVLFFYVLNLVMVGLDLLLYARNRKLDLEAEISAEVNARIKKGSKSKDNKNSDPSA